MNTWTVGATGLGAALPTAQAHCHRACLSADSPSGMMTTAGLQDGPTAPKTRCRRSEASTQPRLQSPPSTPSAALTLSLSSHQTSEESIRDLRQGPNEKPPDETSACFRRRGDAYKSPVHLVLRSSLKIDAFELWCWRRPLRAPWTARRSSQSILKEINPVYSLEGLLLKLQ